LWEVYIEQETLTLQGHLVGGIYGAGDINISGAAGERHITEGLISPALYTLPKRLISLFFMLM
jgi:hypothetical protein